MPRWKLELERGNFLWTRSACCRDGKGNAGEYREVERGSLGNGVHLSARDIETRSSQRGESKRSCQNQMRSTRRERERERGTEKNRERDRETENEKRKGDTAAEIELPGLSDRYTATKRIDETGTHVVNVRSPLTTSTRNRRNLAFSSRSTCQRAWYTAPGNLATGVLYITVLAVSRAVVVRGFTGSFRNYPLVFYIYRLTFCDWFDR